MTVPASATVQKLTRKLQCCVLLSIHLSSKILALLLLSTHNQLTSVIPKNLPVQYHIHLVCNFSALDFFTN